MAKARKSKTKKLVRKFWSTEQLKQLRRHSKGMTPVAKLEKLFKRSAATIRQKARSLGLSLGHTKRRNKKR
jgi:hypothetical protein